jgi:hypothetical protein
VSLELILTLHEAIGFAKPDPDDRIREDDPTIVEFAHAFLEAGASEVAVRRMLHVYGDNLRRLATAVSDVYRGEIEKQLRDSGMAESELMGHGARLGHRMGSLMRQALVAIFERHHQHVWTDYSIGLAETALERAGLRQRVERPPAICFVDLTGYTTPVSPRNRETRSPPDWRRASPRSSRRSPFVTEAERSGGWETAACFCSPTRRGRSWRRWRWSSAPQPRDCPRRTSGSR